MIAGSRAAVMDQDMIQTHEVIAHSVVGHGERHAKKLVDRRHALARVVGHGVRPGFVGRCQHVADAIVTERQNVVDRSTCRVILDGLALIVRVKRQLLYAGLLSQKTHNSVSYHEGANICHPKTQELMCDFRLVLRRQSSFPINLTLPEYRTIF